MTPDTRSARDVAIGLLARREHSRQELRQKLKLRGWMGDEVESLLDDLAEKGLQSEARFAEAFVRSRYAKGQGPIKVQSQLAAKGIDRATAAAACTQSELDWIGQGKRVYERKFGCQPATGYADRAKRYRFLAQRGFTASHIDAILRTDR